MLGSIGPLSPVSPRDSKPPSQVSYLDRYSPMEPLSSTPDSPHLAPSGTGFIFPHSHNASLHSLVTGAIRSGEIGGNPLNIGDPSLTDSFDIEPESMASRSNQGTGRARDREESPAPTVGRRTPSRSRASQSASRRSQASSRIAVAKVTSSSERASHNDESNNGPNTRSRKRRTTKPSSSSEPSSPVKKKTRVKPTASLKKPPPAPKIELDEQKPPAEENSTCCICMCSVEPEELSLINGCDHQFCFECIEKWAERENTCPLCKMRFTKIDRVNKRRKKGTKNTKKVKQRDQRSDLVPGAALEGLLANFASRHPFPPQSIARLIFSGVGNGFIEFNSGHGPSSLRGRSASRAMPAAEDSLYSSDTDEEDNPFSGFFRAMHGRSLVMGGEMQVVRPVSFTTHIPSRSYASNVNDRNAGNGAENPLEIDDDSDDEVEVVQVMRPS